MAEKGISVLILAAGEGRRAAARGLKILQPLLGGSCALERVLRVFLEVQEVQELICVVQPQSLHWLHEHPHFHSLRWAYGGETRAQSFLQGLAQVDTPWLVVHDAARPLITPEMVRQLWAHRSMAESAGLSYGTPLRDSLKVVSPSLGKCLVEASLTPVTAECLWLTHTPQLFPTHLLRNLAAAHAQQLHPPQWRDEVEWLLGWGLTPKLLASPILNWKLTYAEDFEWVEQLLRAREPSR